MLRARLAQYEVKLLKVDPAQLGIDAATSALAHTFPVIRANTTNRSKVLRAWIRRLTRWCLPASKPNSSTSIMCEIHVSGCQLPACDDEKAHRMPSAVTPEATGAFSTTYCASSKLTKG